MAAVLTIGYEGRTVEDFIQGLLSSGVQILVDVRWTPISRKPGFSKSTLKAALESAGIQYVHIRALGAPASLRRNLYKRGLKEEFFLEYRKHLLENESALREAAELVDRGTSCLLCVERRPHDCHRHIVAEELQSLSQGPLRVEHL